MIMTENNLPSSFHDYIYLQKLEHPDNHRYSFSISFEIPLNPKYSSSFKVSIMGLVKDKKIQNFELYLTLWSLDNENIKPSLAAQEISSLDLEQFKEIKNDKVKIDTDFTDFLEKTCKNVIKPYIKNINLDSSEYLKKFDKKIIKFVEQVRKKDTNTIFGENQCSLVSIILFLEAIENDNKKKFFNHLNSDLGEKPNIKGKKI